MSTYQIGSIEHRYDVENIIRVFGYRKAAENATLTAEPTEGGIAVSLLLPEGSKHLILLDDVDSNERKRRLYRFLSRFSGQVPEWGILVGVRPVKTVHKLIAEGRDDTEIRRILAEEYLIAPGKIDLMLEIAHRERPFLDPLDARAVCLYVSIPFCPTRCSYCSFPAASVAQKGRLIPAYLEKLGEEINTALIEIARSGRRVDCVYIGGGTPSVLTVGQIRALFERIGRGVDRRHLAEVTFEAGRIDTIDDEKLEVLRDLGVTRISINPQSLTPEVLAAAGRFHDEARLREVFARAHELGFLINSDLIVGLPGETPESFLCSLRGMLELAPQNLTVHALSLKRGSKLNEEGESVPGADEFAGFTRAYREMLTLIREHGLVPYYLYRQKNIAGNLENIGYARPGTECVYNIRIIEEKHTIVACGVGAVSKICFPEEDRHEQIPNPRGIEDYLARPIRRRFAVETTDSLCYNLM